MEPIILELEREENDLLIIAHESVLRVLYGYLMACNAADIPKLEFPRDEIIEVRSHPIPSNMLLNPPHTYHFYFYRSSPPHTTTLQNASKSLTYPKAWSPVVQRISKCPSRQVVL
jgi:broad specificity phosphatase PhoE